MQSIPCAEAHDLWRQQRYPYNFFKPISIMKKSVSKSLQAFAQAVISVAQQKNIKGGNDQDGGIIIIDDVVNG